MAPRPGGGVDCVGCSDTGGSSDDSSDDSSDSTTASDERNCPQPFTGVEIKNCMTYPGMDEPITIVGNGRDENSCDRLSEQELADDNLRLCHTNEDQVCYNQKFPLFMCEGISNCNYHDRRMLPCVSNLTEDSGVIRCGRCVTVDEACCTNKDFFGDGDDKCRNDQYKCEKLQQGNDKKASEKKVCFSIHDLTAYDIPYIHKGHALVYCVEGFKICGTASHVIFDGKSGAYTTFADMCSRGDITCTVKYTQVGMVQHQHAKLVKNAHPGLRTYIARRPISRADHLWFYVLDRLIDSDWVGQFLTLIQTRRV